MRSRAYAAAVLAFGTTLGGCAATTTTSKVAVDYNRIFAKSRDEVLVTNILRASAREPLQFSTMGAVSGSVRNNGSITIPLTNLIGGEGGLTISPSLTANDGINPTVSIVPLSGKEFTEGILAQVKLETLEVFQNQGWDPEMLLTLAVGGVVCPDGVAIFNSGFAGEKYDAFVSMFQSVHQKAIVTAGADKPYARLRLPAKEAMILVKDGAGKGRKVIELTQDGTAPGDIKVTIVTGGKPSLVKLNVSGVCKDNLVPAPVPDGTVPPKPQEPEILLRSVEAIIYFLGETQRYRSDRGLDCMVPASANRWPHYNRTRHRRNEQGKLIPVLEQITIVHLEKACGKNSVPTTHFLRTRFNAENYYVRSPLSFDPRDRTASCALDKPPQYCDRTLSTLSLLNQLIALQTSGSTIEASKPVVTIESN